MTNLHRRHCGARVFETMENALKAEARRFVEARAIEEPPANTLPSMLSLLGVGPLDPKADLSDPDVSRPIASWLRNSLRRERSRSRSGSAGYDLGRHIALHEMLGHLQRVCPAAAKAESLPK